MVELGEVKINNGISKKKFRIIYVITIIVSVLIMYISLQGFIEVKVLGKATKTEANVTRNIYSSTNKNNYYSVEFEYVVDSNKYIAQEKQGDKVSKYDIGEKIEIYYNNDNIQNAKIYRVSYLMLSFSIIILIMMTIILVNSEKRRLNM